MIVNGNLILYECKKLKSLGKLKEVKGNLSCPEDLEDLGDLEEVGEDLYLYECNKLKSLGKLKEVNKTIYLFSSGITKEYMRENHFDLLEKCIWSR